MKKDNGAVEAKKYGIERSPEWPRVEHEHLALLPDCAVCGISGAVQVHHCFPFHYCIALGRPDLELDERNLITLCETEKGIQTNDHHLLIGHFDDFKSSNLSVRDDSKLYNFTSDLIRADKAWLSAKMNKLKPLNKMNDQEKADLLDLMNKTLPKL